MIKIRLYFIAIVSILGIGGAYSASNRFTKYGSRYFSVTDYTGGFIWVSEASMPSNYICQPEGGASLCTVTSVSRPAPNSIPAGYLPDGHINIIR